jgi:hypothetical protein
VSCLTCGDIVDSSQSNSDSTPTLAPPELLRLQAVGGSFDDTELLRCRECRALFAHRHARDSDTGITDDALRRLIAPHALLHLVSGLQWPSIEPKTELLETLAERIPAPSLESLKPPFGDLDLCRVEILGAAAAPLIPELGKHLDEELGARALAAAGAWPFLEGAARRGGRPAIRALGRSGPASVVPVLVEVLLHSAEGMARREAAQGLGRLGAAREVLYSVMTTVSDSTVTWPARDALARMGATELLLDGLLSPNWSVRWMAAVGLGAAGNRSPEILTALERAVLAPGGALITRTSAFDALLLLGVDRAHLEVVTAPGLEHPDEDIRRSSKLCLERL